MLIGVFDGTNRKPYLVEVAELECTDNVLIGQLVNNTLANFFNVIPYDKFKLFISDAASYMILAADRMKSGFCPNLVNNTCLARGLNRLAEFVRSKHPTTDHFIGQMKKFFKHSSSRKRDYENFAGRPMYPTPIVTRWGTWLEAVFYYCSNFERVCEFIDQTPDEDCQTSDNLKRITSRDVLSQELAFITSSFRPLAVVITKMEERQSLPDGVAVFLEIDVLGEYKSKLVKILNKSPEFEYLLKVAQVSRGESVVDFAFSPSLALNMKLAPLVSVDIERVFSVMTRTLAPQRERFTVEHLKWALVAAWNEI